MKRLFTVDEANRILPNVKTKLASILKLRKRIKRINNALMQTVDVEESENLPLLKQEIEHLYTHLTNEMEHLELMGVIVKDINHGLIDFHTEFEGREVCLCWKYGEDKVKFWHEIQDGALGRKPIHYIG